MDVDVDAVLERERQADGVVVQELLPFVVVAAEKKGIVDNNVKHLGLIFQYETKGSYSKLTLIGAVIQTWLVPTCWCS